MKSNSLMAILGLLAVAVYVPAAMAADSFSRFYISGGIGQKSVNVEESVNGPGGAGSANLGNNAMFGQVAAGYNLVVGENIRLGFGVFYDLGEGKGGDINGTVGAVAATYTIKEKNHYGLSFEPGYAFTKDSVAYGKLTYNWIKVEHTLEGGTVAFDSSTLNTFGYGLGIKHLIGGKTYLYAEWQKVQYNGKPFDDGAGNTITYRPSENFGLVGVGVNF
jgi:hypothetical protein